MRQTLKEYRDILRQLYAIHNTVPQALDKLREEIDQIDTYDPDTLTEATVSVLASRKEATLEQIAQIQETLRNRCEDEEALLIMARAELNKSPQEILNELSHEGGNK